MQITLELLILHIAVQSIDFPNGTKEGDCHGLRFKNSLFSLVQFLLKFENRNLGSMILGHSLLSLRLIRDHFSEEIVIKASGSVRIFRTILILHHWEDYFLNLRIYLRFFRDNTRKGFF